MRRSAAGSLVVLADSDASGAMIRLHCDILVPKREA